MKGVVPDGAVVSQLHQAPALGGHRAAPVSRSAMTSSKSRIP